MAKRKVIKADKIVVDEKISYENACLYIEDDVIVSIKENPGWKDNEYQLLDYTGYKVFPGLIDIHLHGALGKDFVEGSQEAVDIVSSDVIKDGVTAYAASLTVLSHEKMLEVLAELGKASSPVNGARYLGIHAEGPYISKKFKALMNELYIREPNLEEMREMIRVSRGRLLLMTYSPHYDNAAELLTLGKENNVKMMIGHTEANSAQAIAALQQGASGYTHFYNAMSGHHHRDEGVVTAGLISTAGYAEIIADKVHVTPNVLKFTYEVMGSSRMILVTDAMPGKSMADGTFYFSDLESVKKDGKAYVKATGRLAGSVIGLNEALYNMREICGCSDNELVEMACVNPAKLLEQNSLGTLIVGKQADLTVFDENYRCQLTMVGGNIVYQR